MAFRAGQFNFSKGVLSPELQGRIDVDAYNAAVRVGTNVVVLKHGGLQKRLGTRMVYEIKDGPKRLFPHEYSIEQTYALMFGQGDMRPAAMGGMVLEEALTITAITKAANAQVSQALHGNAVGDEIFYSGILGMTQMNGRVATVVSVVNDGAYTIDIDTTSFDTFTGDTGGITRVIAAPPPPTPPVVPPVVTPPPPPVIGGSGGGGGGGGRPLGPNENYP